jgi:Holliday junction resolvase RusA-like endonuclease
LNIDPPTKTYQEHRVGISKNGKPYFYEDRELKQICARYHDALIPLRPPEPLTGPLRLLVKWCFPKGKHSDGQYKDTKPDTDNLIKMLKDEMTRAGFWKDDSQVASEINEKFWADKPGIYVRIDRLEDT